MSAETLRAAAQLMRECAEAATSPNPEQLGDWFEVGSQGLSNLFVGEQMHIASWHPAVALAVADWLDECARVWDMGENSADADMHYAPIGRHALTVARAYLGESA